ncbi:hypothetical protein BU17DRAFT_88022 [Hysterangium stoloniferum]|nr:hypothetical protein BU17DRAFT_88022 [Hysterangium stoloniferum]
MHNRHFPRQDSPTGESTAASAAAPTSTLLLDPSLPLGVTAALSAPVLGTTTLTLLPSFTSTAPSDTPTSSTTPSTSPNKLPTSTLIGIIVAIFIFLASLLVVFMTFRHRRKNQKRRGGKGSRKPWTKLQENKNDKTLVNVPMRTVFETSAPPTSASALPSPRLPASTSQFANPFLPALPSEAVPAAAASSLSHIPNPFTSPPNSPSPPHSRSPSNATDRRSPSIRLSAFPAVQYANHLSMASSAPSDYASQRGSEYHHVFDSYAEQDKDSHSELTPQSQSQPQSQYYPQYNLKPQVPVSSEQARARELKAMQDIISALDSTNARHNTSQTTPSSTPSAWKDTLIVDTVSGKGSRLSMGEGLVTPVEHSIRSEEGSFIYERRSVATEVDVDHFPLPPSDPFKAILGEGNNVGRGKAKTGNPF